MPVVLPSPPQFFFKFSFIDFREREEGREKHQFVVPLSYAFIGWFLYVPWSKIEPATFLYWDNALTNWVTQPGLPPLCTILTWSDAPCRTELSPVLHLFYHSSLSFIHSSSISLRGWSWNIPGLGGTHSSALDGCSSWNVFSQMFTCHLMLLQIPKFQLV